MRTQRGFTLLEIIISMSLFTLIGFAVVLLMRTATDMWLRGNEGSLQEDRLQQSLPRLEDDLRHTLPARQVDRRPFDPKNPDPEKEPDPLPPENRFVSGYMTYRIGERDYACRYLAFVRDIEGLGEIETFRMRAGSNPQAQSYIDGQADWDEFTRRDHLPTGGKIEVLWIWLPNEGEPGVGTVYRAFRTPIGGAGTLLDPKNYDELKEVKENIRPTPMFQNVILFDLFFWTQYTTTWDWSAGEPVVTGPPKSIAEIKAGRQRCGPSRTWDSTRGFMTGDAEAGFKLAHGKESFNYSGDDIWPRMVRVEFALKEEQTLLVRPLGSGDQEFTVDAPDFATGRGDLYGQFIKVGTEWIRIRGRDGDRRDTFLIDRRAQHGTAALAHAADTPVYFGRIFDTTILVPSFRDDNN